VIETRNFEYDEDNLLVAEIVDDGSSPNPKRFEQRNHKT
jgi:hypothetical protein